MIREPKVGDEVVCNSKHELSGAAINIEDLGKIIKIGTLSYHHTHIKVKWYKSKEEDWYFYPNTKSSLVNYAPEKPTTNKIEQIKKDILKKIDLL